MAIDPNVLWGCLLDDLTTYADVFRLYPSDPSKLGAVGRPFGHGADIFAADALLRSAIKKCTDGADKSACEQAAVEKFVACNEELKSRRSVIDVSQLGPYDEVILGEFRRSMYNFWTPEGFHLLDHGGIASYVDHGPGASPGVDETSFYHKIGDSALSAPNSLVEEMYYEWVKGSQLRVDSEIARLVKHGPVSIQDTVKMSFAPKTAVPPMARAIRPEPPLGMFFQKGIQRILEGQLTRHFGINFSTQQRANSALAKEGSVTGQYATLDLESASDLISFDFCREFIPRQSFFWLNAVRTPKAVLPNGQVVDLKMMTTMGCAYCSPLQTIIFSCMVEAVYKALGLPFLTSCPKTVYSTTRETETGRWEHQRNRRDGKNWGVFGDDIIVHRDAFEPLCRLLRAFGMKPNALKSFNTDSFRESCGSDYYSGVDVRGVYLKSLKTPQDIVIALNNLFDWSVEHKIELRKTLNLLRVDCETKKVPFVPPWETPDAGIRVPLVVACQYGAVWLTKKVQADAPCSSLTGLFLYKRLRPVPRRVQFEKKLRGCFVDLPGFNASAKLLAAVRGMMKGGGLTLRSWSTHYMKEKGITPCWEWYPTLDPRFGSEKNKSEWINSAFELWVKREVSP